MRGGEAFNLASCSSCRRRMSRTSSISSPVIRRVSENCCVSEGGVAAPVTRLPVEESVVVVFDTFDRLNNVGRFAGRGTRVESFWGFSRGVWGGRDGKGKGSLAPGAV